MPPTSKPGAKRHARTSATPGAPRLNASALVVRPSTRKARSGTATTVGEGVSGNGGLSDREIVRAAREIIAKDGVEGLTMRRLSSRLGVALGATYYHVASKHDLLRLVAQDLYREVGTPAAGSWDSQLRSLMVSLTSIVGRYPGMASFMMSNADELDATDLHDAVRAILRDAGFSERGSGAVLSALFFYVTGMAAGGFADPAAQTVRGRNVLALFEDGLDVLMAGAHARLGDDKKARRPRRSR